MNTNLLLLDSYKNMESLVNYAFSFSRATGRQLKIYYVFDFEWMRQSYTVGSASVADPVLVNVQYNARREFEEAEVRVKAAAEKYSEKHAPDLPYEIYVSDKNRIDLMLEEVDRDPDLLLLISNQQSYAEATGGAMGYPNLVFNLKCPVYIVPDNYSYSEISNIAYATNLHPEDMEALKHLSETFKSSGIKVSLLHNVGDADFEGKLKWKGFVELVKETSGLDSVEPVVTHEKKTLDAIESYVNKHDVDLLVVLKEKKGFFKEVFSTSHTKNVLTHIDKPVLVYHEK